MLKVKNLLNSAAFRAGIPMVSVKSTRILVFAYNGGLNNGRMYRIQQYTVRHRHQGYGETEDMKFDFIDKRGILLYRPYGV